MDSAAGRGGAGDGGGEEVLELAHRAIVVVEDVAIGEDAGAHRRAVAGIGAEAERFRGLANFTSYGADSPFQMLRDLGGKIAVLDLPDQNAMTIYHHFEEIVEAPYRYHKVFRGEWLDERGLVQWREFDIYVRGEGVVTHVDPMGEILWEKGLYSGDRPGEGCGLRVIDANAMFDATVDVIRKGQALGHLYLKESDL